MAPEAGPGGGDEASPPGWQQVETLGLAEVVMTILEARQTMPSSTAAAVSREQHGDVLHVRVSLLSNPPASGGDSPGPGEPGVVVADFAARRLAQDLTDAFKDNEVIILKLSRRASRGRERMIRR
jgi:hypothetical protein